jgi:hypothetical protein
MEILQGELRMEVMSLKEYIEARPIEKNPTITFERGCSICGRLYHYKNMAFIMGTKIQGYGSVSFNFCPKCLPYWRKAFDRGRSSSPDEWHFSTWDLDKPFPHTEVDRIFLLLKDGEFFLQTDYNPSRRERNMIMEDLR